MKNLTHKQRLLQYLQTHPEGINPLTAWQSLGIYRLADVVYQLRKEGHSITTHRQEVQNRFQEACSVARYTLEQPEQAQEPTKPPPLVIGIKPVPSPKRVGLEEQDEDQETFDFGTHQVS